MNAHVVSVNSGARVPSAATSVGATGIDKKAVGALQVRDPGPRSEGGGSGVVGDFIADLTHHGGSSQAVYLVQAEELAHWSAELGRDLGPGAFGENVTTSGIDLEALPLLTRLSVGEVELEVRVPRVPCRTFAAHMGVRGWVKRFAARGRTGAYCAVIVPGTIGAGDVIEVRSTPDHGVDLSVAFRAAMGELNAADEVLGSGALVEPYRTEMRDAVARRQR